MRVLKKISTPFVQVNPDKAIILINAKDPQINTIKAFLQACRDYKLHYRMFVNKIDALDNYKEQINKLQKEFGITDIVGISVLKGTNFDVIENQVKAWKGNRISILGIFNSGKTSLINRLCNTSYKVGDIPGTTLKFTETNYNGCTLIDSVGQLIDINKPLMVSIDFTGCESIQDKIDRVFNEEIAGIVKTKEGISDSIEDVINVIIKQVKQNNKIITCGAGASALVAKEIAGQGTECGLPVMVFTNDGAEIQPITFSKGLGEQEGGISRYISHAVNENDVVIAVSASGGTGFTYDLLKRAKDKGAITVAITENADTPLGKYADYIIKSNSKPEGPSSSKVMTSHLVIGHTLMLVIADELGITADESVKYMLEETVATKLMGIK